jgi:hypothetical protein
MPVARTAARTGAAIVRHATTATATTQAIARADVSRVRAIRATVTRAIGTSPLAMQIVIRVIATQATGTRAIGTAIVRATASR